MPRLEPGSKKGDGSAEHEESSGPRVKERRGVEERIEGAKTITYT